MTVSVLIVDDQPIVRSGLTTLLDSEPDLVVVGEAENGREAVTRTADLCPDVVLMDIRMPIMDGLEATRRILDSPRCSRVRIVILTTFDLDEYVYEALRAGACGFLLKQATPEEIVLGVRSAADGNALISPAVTTRLIAAFLSGRPRKPHSRELERLTARELEILTLVAGGASNHEIAKRLYITDSTVKTHLTRTLTKLGLRDRVHAVVWAYDTGLVQPGGTP